MEPGPPTFWNRLRCRVHGHFYHLDYYSHADDTVHLICARCSLILVARWPQARVENSEAVQQH